MITHVVFFKLKDRSAGPGRELCDRLLGLKAKIPQIVAIEAGVDVDRSDRAWDAAIVSRFASAADLAIYRDHPEHLKAVAWIREQCQATAVVDYEG